MLQPCYQHVDHKIEQANFQEHADIWTIRIYSLSRLTINTVISYMQYIHFCEILPLWHFTSYCWLAFSIVNPCPVNPCTASVSLTSEHWMVHEKVLMLCVNITYIYIRLRFKWKTMVTSCCCSYSTVLQFNRSRSSTQPDFHPTFFKIAKTAGSWYLGISVLYTKIS